MLTDDGTKWIYGNSLFVTAAVEEIGVNLSVYMDIPDLC
jgi:hypothetical protein